MGMSELSKNVAVTLCASETGPIFVYTDDGVIGYLIRETGHFGEHIIDEVLAYLKERFGFNPHTFVDIGANIGTHTLYSLMPGRFQRALSVEADARNFMLLQANVAIRGMHGRVQLIECALSDRVGMLELELCHSNFGDHRVRMQASTELPDQGESERRTVLVRADTADRVIGAAALPWMETLVWIDTQGHEGQVFAGGSVTLATMAPMLITEFWPYGIERAGGKKEYFDFLDTCVEIIDLSRPNWRSHAPIAVSELGRIYESMLIKSSSGYYPHTDLLCIRSPALDIAQEARRNGQSSATQPNPSADPTVHTSPSPSEFSTWIESPGNIDICSISAQKILLVEGWVPGASARCAEVVELLLDGVIAAELRQLSARPDVSAKYCLPKGPLCGFAFRVAIDIRARPNTVEVRVRSHSRVWTLRKAVEWGTPD